MPDHRRHRGPHPRDRVLFAESRLPALRAAVADLSFLLGRGYAEKSSLALVGNRYQLTVRQRLAVRRCACCDAALAHRRAHRVDASSLRGARLDVDGYNVLITVETALSGGLVLCGRDGSHRDLASLHGTYRRVEETLPGLIAVGETLAALALARVRWLLDSPVSNSGRLASLLRELTAARGWPWEVELANDPDAILARSDDVIASADSGILDRCRGGWFDLAGRTIEEHVERPWLVPL